MGEILVGRTLDETTDSVTAFLSTLANTGVPNGYAWTGVETDRVLWTPASGNKFVVTSMIISCSAAHNVTVFDETNSADNWLFRGDVAQYGGMSHTYGIFPRVSSAVDNELKLTTGASGGWICIWGYEI